MVRTAPAKSTIQIPGNDAEGNDEPRAARLGREKRWQGD
jgi:hypothetical protein